MNLRDNATLARSFIAATLFPPRCAACRAGVSRHGTLCAPCWGQMHFITDPVCLQCGLPFECALGADALCASCMKSPPVFARARSVLRYDAGSRQAVHAFKYRDKTQLAPMFAQWLARAGENFVPDARLILPVPLHWKRLLLRRYNQAALLAHALARHTGLTVLPDALMRIRSTPAQAGLTRKGREHNVHGAFAVRASSHRRLAGQSILLVDDVMTTGATLNACARALHDAGARDVYVLTLARTVLTE